VLAKREPAETDEEASMIGIVAKRLLIFWLPTAAHGWGAQATGCAPQILNHSCPN
jgi:hypothetical protein